jgi:uncharacterized protein
MARVQALHLSPIKSLRLQTMADATIGRDGFLYDREFLFLDERNRVATQRQLGVFAQLTSTYDGTTLTITLPGGETVSGEPVEHGSAHTELWGREITGPLILGPWNEAVSAVAGKPLRLMRPDAPQRGRDSHPMSVLSQAAVDKLGTYAQRNGDLDARRFRPSILIDGCAAHAEDEWVGRRVRVGEAVLDVVRLDPRCVLTTRNPDTGDRDADTLRWIDQTRGRVDGEVCFGVYADVAEPGVVRVGDSIQPLDQETS